jgi:hypothetical protein
MYTYCHLKQQKERFTIDFVVSCILCILETNDRMYLDKMGIVKKRLFFHNSFFVCADICTLKCFCFRDFLLQKYMKGVLFDGKNGKIN